MTQQFTTCDRQDWMAVLARAPADLLENLWSGFDGKPSFKPLREPETGLVMVRARAGGEGAQFNMGEATVTRCSVISSTGQTGHAYVLGRDVNHARAAAEIDAGLQDGKLFADLDRDIIQPLKNAHDKARQLHRGKVAATRVDFFTLVRGEDD
ncbi:MAG: phosphonate C-P lyase system protein PhnG [Pseudomonadota bacterium]